MTVQFGMFLKEVLHVQVKWHVLWVLRTDIYVLFLKHMARMKRENIEHNLNIQDIRLTMEQYHMWIHMLNRYDNVLSVTCKVFEY